MLDNKFDKILKNKLEGLSLDSSMADWSSFEGKYEDYLSDDMDQVFDESVKSKLESSSSIAVPSGAGWDTFEAKFGAALTSDEGFDTEIRDNVNEYRVDFNPSHWELLKLKIERIIHLRRTLYTSKAFECVMVLLIMLTFINYFPILEDHGKKRNYEVAESPIERLHMDTESIQSNYLSTEQLDKAEILSSNSSASEDNLGELASIYSEDEKILAQNQRTEILTDNSESGKLAYNEMESPIFSISQAGEQNENFISNGSLISSGETASIDALAIIPSLSTTLRGGERTISLGLEPVILDPSIQTEDSKGLWFHTVLATNLNMVQSTFGTPIGEDHYRASGIGYAAGMALSYDIKRWSISTGLQFSSYNYTPDANEENYIRETEDGEIGEYVISLDEIQHNNIQVPLMVSYDFLGTTSSFKLFGSLGANLNIINTIDYNIRNELLNTFPNPGGVPVPWTNPDAFASKDYIRGRAEGGSFAETASLYLTAGIGLQKNFGQAMALYIHPSYQIPVTNTKIHPNGDKISKLAIDFGLKFKLAYRAH